MSADSYEELRRHIGHKIVCVCYALPGETEDPACVTIECETCYEVLVEYEQE